MKIFSFFSKINKKILLFVSLFLIFAVSVGLLLLPSKDTQLPELMKTIPSILLTAIPMNCSPGSFPPTG